MPIVTGLSLSGVAQVLVGSVLGALVVRKVAGPAQVACADGAKGLPPATVKGVDDLSGDDDEVIVDAEDAEVVDDAGSIAEHRDPHPHRRDREGHHYGESAEEGFAREGVEGDDVGRHHHHGPQGQPQDPWGPQWPEGHAPPWARGARGRQGQNWGRQGPRNQQQQVTHPTAGMTGRTHVAATLYNGSTGKSAGSLASGSEVTVTTGARVQKPNYVYVTATDAKSRHRLTGLLPISAVNWPSTGTQGQQEYSPYGPQGYGQPGYGPQEEGVWGVEGAEPDGVNGWGVPYRVSTSKWSLPVRVVDKGGVPGKFVFSAWAIPAHVVTSGGVPVRDVGAPLATATATTSATPAPAPAAAPVAKVSGFRDGLGALSAEQVREMHAAGLSPQQIAAANGGPRSHGMSVNDIMTIVAGSTAALANVATPIIAATKVSGWTGSPATVAGWGDQLFKGLEIGGSGVATAFLGPEAGAAVRTLGETSKAAIDRETGHDPNAGRYPVSALLPGSAPAPASAPLSPPAGDVPAGSTRGAIRVAPGATVYCGPTLQWVPLKSRGAVAAPNT